MAGAAPPSLPDGAVERARRPASLLPALNAILAVLLLAVLAGPFLAAWLAPGPGRPPAAPPDGPGHSGPPPELGGSPGPPGDPPPVPAVAAAAPSAAARPASGACEGPAPADPAARRQLALCLGRLGRDLYRAGRPAEARARYRRAVDLDPGTRELWIGLALAHRAAGDPAGAGAALAEALGRFPGDPEALYLRAESEERAGRTAEAIGTLRALLARTPAFPRAAALLARLEREQRVEGGYWAQESAHFLVRYEGAGGLDVGRSVTDALEGAREALGRELDVYPPGRVQVGIYRTEVLGGVLGFPAHHVRGAFDGRKLRLNLAQSVADSSDLDRLVRHEYAHLLIDLASRGRAPVWVHEGLAQVLEPRPAPRFLEVPVDRGLLTLAGIERLGRTMEPAAFTAGYQLMHVAAQHLVDRGGMAGVRAFLRRLGQGEPVPAALQGAFGFGVGEVEARLLAFGGKG